MVWRVKVVSAVFAALLHRKKNSNPFFAPVLHLLSMQQSCKDSKPYGAFQSVKGGGARKMSKISVRLP